MRLLLVAVLLASMAAGCVSDQAATQPAQPAKTDEVVSMADMKITSMAFGDGGNIPSKYTCDGADVSPPLEMTNVPSGAKSLALIVDDPDAPAGDWVHWLIWNISPKTAEIHENSVPAGSTQGLTDFRTNGYGGPCPPSGTHRYLFKLYALDTTLSLGSNARKADLLEAMKGHIVAQAQLTGRYRRS